MIMWDQRKKDKKILSKEKRLLLNEFGDGT